MDQISLAYEKSCLLKPDELNDTVKELTPEIERVIGAIASMDETDYAFARVPRDVDALRTVQELIAQKKKLQPTMLIVVGIGGSNLGTMAVQQAIYGQFYNDQMPNIKIYFVDTVDSDRTNDVVLLMEQELQQQGSVILSIVSKSGATLETVANADIFIELLKEYKKENYQEHVVVTTDHDSLLWHVAREEHFACLEIPRDVGGRFSVFTPVGLFPLGFIDLDIEELLLGAEQASEWCVRADSRGNLAAVSAAILKLHYFNEITVCDTFLFCPDLEMVGKWYRQLLAESVGKEFDRDGGLVEVGITPTVSIGSTDLHSVGQLYLGGPRDKFINFVVVDQENSELLVPNNILSKKLVPQIAGRSLPELMRAIFEGVTAAYTQAQRPYVVWRLPAKKERFIGQFLQCKLFEVLYVGYLLNINPFNQPNVELYKRETGKILGR